MVQSSRSRGQDEDAEANDTARIRGGKGREEGESDKAGEGKRRRHYANGEPRREREGERASGEETTERACDWLRTAANEERASRAASESWEQEEE